MKPDILLIMSPSETLLEEIIMSRIKYSIAAIVTAAILATGALAVTSPPSVAADTEIAMPGTAGEHAAEAARYEQEAQALEAKADQHTDLAARYRARASGSNKKAAGLRSLSNHCKSLAKAYRTAANEAREMAKSHRSMGAAD
ncbi:MAG: hypothetical protein Q8N51_05655 [Gammaproteobacteria bacterium]|nr:hypothetical protein [Gammaproteobacteria bacterium]